jgi:hypothetical protein
MTDDHKNSNHGSSTTPRWVKVFGIVLIALVLLVVMVLLVSGGDHGPGRHLPSSDIGGQTASSTHGARQA